MKLKILIPLLITGIFRSYAQQLQSRAVEPFNKIQVSGALTVVYTNSDTTSVNVKASSKELDKVETKVINSTLVISNKGSFKNPVFVYVKNNKLTYVESSGATDFETTNVLTGDSIGFDVSGAASLHAMLNTKKLETQQSGATEMELTGSTNNLFAEVSGAASFKGYNLVAKNVEIFTSGAAMAKVNASEKIRANATGASDIKIKGDAQDVSADATASADIVKVSGPKGIAGLTDTDSTFYHFKHKKIIVIRDKSDINTRKGENEDNENHFRHWTGISFGVNGYMSSGNISLPAKEGYMDVNYSRSFNFQLNVFERQFNIINNNFKLITGIGLDFHLYELANSTTLNPDSTFTFGTIDSTKSSYRKNKLRATYVQVPLLFEFNTSNDPYKTFHVAVGIIGQFLLSSRTKQVVEEDRYVLTRVRKDSYNLSPFAAKAHINIGYKGWTIFAEYSLTNLFQAGKGPELSPFSVGLRVIPFA